MSRTDRETAKDALDQLAVLHRHLARGDLDDQTIADAVSMRLAAAIEAIAHSSDGLRARLFAGDWHIAWATRNRIAHSYVYVDHRTISATVSEDLPALEAALAAEIEESDQTAPIGTGDNAAIALTQTSSRQGKSGAAPYP